MENQYTIGALAFIVLLIFPGVIFKRFYFQGHFTNSFGIGPFADRLVTSIFWGICMSVITFIIYLKITRLTYDDVFVVTKADYRNISRNELPDVKYDQFKDMLGYLGCLLTVSMFMGTLCYWIVRLLKLDYYWEVFRFGNRLSYLVKGDTLSRKIYKNLKSKKIDVTSVDIMMDVGEDKNKLISGFLTEVVLSERTGEIECIYLTAARKLIKEPDNYENIPGDCFIVPYDRIVDINLTYIFKVINKEESGRHTAEITAMIAILLGVLSFIYPWFLEGKVLQKIALLLASALASIFTLGLLSDLLSKKKTTSVPVYVALVILDLIFLGVIVYILNRIFNFL